jgi:hypothetical protein
MKTTRLQLSYKLHTDFRSGFWLMFKAHFERVGYESSARFSHLVMTRVPADMLKKSFGGSAIPKGLFLQILPLSLPLPLPLSLSLPLPATSLYVSVSSLPVLISSWCLALPFLLFRTSRLPAFLCAFPITTVTPSLPPLKSVSCSIATILQVRHVVARLLEISLVPSLTDFLSDAFDRLSVKTISFLPSTPNLLHYALTRAPNYSDRCALIDARDRSCSPRAAPVVGD